jgi:hypothetical protein
MCHLGGHIASTTLRGWRKGIKSRVSDAHAGLRQGYCRPPPTRDEQRVLRECGVTLDASPHSRVDTSQADPARYWWRFFLAGLHEPLAVPAWPVVRSEQRSNSSFYCEIVQFVSKIAEAVCRFPTGETEYVPTSMEDFSPKFIAGLTRIIR